MCVVDSGKSHVPRAVVEVPWRCAVAKDKKEEPTASTPEVRIGEIDPCPTCRGRYQDFNKGVVEVCMKHEKSISKYWVRCTVCQRRSGFYRSMQTAVQEWNRGRTVHYSVPQRKNKKKETTMSTTPTPSVVRKSVTISTSRELFIDLPHPPNFLRVDGVMMSVGHFSESEAHTVGQAIAEQFEQHVRRKREQRLEDQRKGL